MVIIPQEHIATVNDLQSEHAAMVGKLVTTAKSIAADRGFADQGYRLVINCNAEGGQTVFHIHLHLLGGRSLTWPPG